VLLVERQETWERHPVTRSPAAAVWDKFDRFHFILSNMDKKIHDKCVKQRKKLGLMKNKTQTHNTKYKRKSTLTVTGTFNVNSTLHRAGITMKSAENHSVYKCSLV